MFVLTPSLVNLIYTVCAGQRLWRLATWDAHGACEFLIVWRRLLDARNCWEDDSGMGLALASLFRNDIKWCFAPVCELCLCTPGRSARAYGTECLLQVIWRVPETSYRRSSYLNTDLSSASDLGNGIEDSRPMGGVAGSTHVSSTAELGAGSGEKRQGGNTSLEPTRERHSLAKRMRLFNGRYTNESPFKIFLRPIVLLVHPAIIWGMLTQGALIGWTVMIGVVLGVIVSAY